MLFISKAKKEWEEWLFKYIYSALNDELTSWIYVWISWLIPLLFLLVFIWAFQQIKTVTGDLTDKIFFNSFIVISIFSFFFFIVFGKNYFLIRKIYKNFDYYVNVLKLSLKLNEINSENFLSILNMPNGYKDLEKKVWFHKFFMVEKTYKNLMEKYWKKNISINNMEEYYYKDKFLEQMEEKEKKNKLDNLLLKDEVNSKKENINNIANEIVEKVEKISNKKGYTENKYMQFIPKLKT